MSEDIFHLGVKALIVNTEGKVLLLRVNPSTLSSHNNDYWDLPGGRVQKGEIVAVTLTREVFEETNIDNLTPLKEMGMVLANIRIPISSSDTVGLILAIYECKYHDSSKIVLSNEHMAFGWFSATEAAELLAVKYPKNFCELIASK